MIPSLTVTHPQTQQPTHTKTPPATEPPRYQHKRQRDNSNPPATKRQRLGDEAMMPPPTSAAKPQPNQNPITTKTPRRRRNLSIKEMIQKMSKPKVNQTVEGVDKPRAPTQPNTTNPPITSKKRKREKKSHIRSHKYNVMEVMFTQQTNMFTKMTTDDNDSIVSDKNENNSLANDRIDKEMTPELPEVTRNQIMKPNTEINPNANQIVNQNTNGHKSTKKCKPNSSKKKKSSTNPKSEKEKVQTTLTSDGNLLSFQHTLTENNPGTSSRGTFKKRERGKPSNLNVKPSLNGSLRQIESCHPSKHIMITRFFKPVKPKLSNE